MQTACSAKIGCRIVSLKLTVLSGLERFDYYWDLSGNLLAWCFHAFIGTLLLVISLSSLVSLAVYAPNLITSVMFK